MSIEKSNFVISRASTAHSRTWVRQELNFDQFLDLFSNHRLDRKKDGPAFVAGELNGTERKAQAVRCIYFLVYDVDGEQTYDEVREILNRENLHALMYSTYNHLKTKSYIKTDKFALWCKRNGIDTTPAIGQVLHTQELVERYVDDNEGRAKFGGAFEVQERREQTEEGMQICLKHAPIEKFRIVIPLDVPFMTAAHGYTSAEQAQIWKRHYIGVGRKLGLKFDMACSDPSRIHYLPSHPSDPADDTKEAEHRMDHLFDPVNGEEDGPSRVSLDLTKYPLADIGEVTKRTTAGVGVAQPQVGLMDLGPWLRKYRGTYKLATLLEERGRTLGARTEEGYVCTCPYGDRHTEGEDGAFVVDADPKAGTPFVFSCSHNSCQRKMVNGAVDVAVFLEKMLAEGWITHGDLENPNYGGGPLLTWDDSDDLPFPFYRHDGMILTHLGKCDDWPVSQDFEIVASTLDHRLHHGVGIAFIDRLGEHREVFFMYSQLVGRSDDWLGELADEGFIVHDAKQLGRLLNLVRPREKLMRTHKPGWTSDGKFVLPGVGDVKLVGKNEVLGQNGKLTEWQNIARLARGNSRLTFALCQMFVGPLLKPLNGESGAFHLFSTTSDGKTATLRLAASVWGRAPITLNTTLTGLETTLEHANDIGVCLDELGQLERGAGGVAYMLGNESGKGRGKSDGGKRETKSFRVAAMTCGEMAFSEKVEDEGKKSTGGHGSRVVTINANAGHGLGVYDTLHDFPGGAALSEHIKAAVGEHHGVAGPAFISWLTEEGRLTHIVDEFGPALGEIADHLTPVGAAPQVRRIAMRFAFVLLAGELAVEAGVLPFEAGEPSRVVLAIWNEWLGGRGTNTDEVYQGTERILTFMKTKPQAFESKSVTPIDRHGFFEPVDHKKGTRPTWYWLPEKFRAVVANSASVGVAEALLTSGCLVAGEMRKATGKRRLDVKKRGFEGMPDGQRYYAVMLPEEKSASPRSAFVRMLRMQLSPHYEVGGLDDGELLHWLSAPENATVWRERERWMGLELGPGCETEEGVVERVVG